MKPAGVAGLSKRYGALLALDKVDLQFDAGAVHALVGENGSGKSTLFNIMAGIVGSTAGKVTVGPGQAAGWGPAAARAAGIGLLSQHGSLLPELSVLDNFALASSGLGRIDRQRLGRETNAALGRLGVECDLRRKVADLPAGQARRIELARLLWSGMEVVLLDEPTAWLPPNDAAALFDLLRKLADDGLTIVFSSHVIEDVLERADTVSVLRKGKAVWSGASADLDQRLLLTLMFGEAAQDSAASRPAAAVQPQPSLQLDKIVCEGAPDAVVDLTVRRGEALGVVGSAGQGQERLLETVCGLRAPLAGTIKVGGKERGDLSHYDWGLRRLPADAVGQAAVAAMCVDENLALHLHDREPYAGWGNRVLLPGVMQREGKRVVAQERLGIADSGAELGWLSGGNQRKLLIAREMKDRPLAIVMHNQEAGLDRWSLASLTGRILAAKQAGAGALLFADDFDWLEQVADRFFAMVDGRLHPLSQASWRQEAYAFMS